MDAVTRRERIKELLAGRKQPRSAAALAKELGVSRQVIVGDVALLRAQGCAIVATARGYLLEPPVSQARYIGTIACRHSLEDTEIELLAVVERGGEVLDVTVEHELYGEITGRLGIATREDVEAFMASVRGQRARLLSELTGGVHNHTIACKDAAAFRDIVAQLDRMAILYRAT